MTEGTYMSMMFLVTHLVERFETLSLKLEDYDICGRSYVRRASKRQPGIVPSDELQAVL